MKLFRRMCMGRLHAWTAVGLLLFAARLNAQVLATGETGGKGNKALLLSANGLFADGLNLFSPYAQFVYGAHPRADILLSAGTTTALGRTQSFVGGGAIVQLLKRDRALVDISSFNIFTTPLNKKEEACGVLFNTALVASHPIPFFGRGAVLYSGVNFLVPIGSREDKLFTPPDLQVNVPLGLSVNLTKRWIIMSEYDAGPKLTSAGIALVRLF
jgi:hypothetical protein